MLACFGLCPIDWVIAVLLGIGIGGTKLANYLRKKRCSKKECCVHRDGEHTEST